MTTNVTGNCGMSAAPLLDPYRDEIISNFFGDGRFGLDFAWNTFGEYLETLSKAPKAINLAPLVGHGTIRSAVIGFAARQPSDDELRRMDLVRQSMEEGAFGMSCGLIFPPGMYSSTEELIALAQVVAEFDGIYSSHICGNPMP